MHRQGVERFLLLAISIFTSLSSASLPADVPICPSGDSGDLQYSICNDKASGTNLGLGDDQVTGNSVNQTIYDLRQPKVDFKFEKSDCIKANNSGTEFCVYSSKDFASGRGISVVGDSGVVDRMLKLPAFTRPEVLRKANDFPSPMHERIHIPNKGMGLVAKRRIYPGELVMSTTPLVYQDHMLEDNLTFEDRLLLQNKAVEKLPPVSLDIFNNLAHHRGGDFVDDVFATNAFKASFYNDTGHEDYNGRGIFPEAAWMNHDCRPNTHYHFDHELMRQHVHATRIIEAGEELTDSYIEVLQSREDRRDTLEWSWGFKCTCRQCTLARPLRIASDSRIRAIHKLRQELNSVDETSRADPEMAELLQSLYEQERVEAAYCDGYSHAAREYNGVGHPHKALKYAHLALEAGLLYEDECGSDMRDMQTMVSGGPRAHWSWRFRLPESPQKANATESATATKEAAKDGEAKDGKQEQKQEQEKPVEDVKKAEEVKTEL